MEQASIIQLKNLGLLFFNIWRSGFGTLTKATLFDKDKRSQKTNHGREKIATCNLTGNAVQRIAMQPFSPPKCLLALEPI